MEEKIQKIIDVLEEMKQARLNRSCSRDALSQANAFETAIAVVKRIDREYETNKP